MANDNRSVPATPVSPDAIASQPAVAERNGVPPSREDKDQPADAIQIVPHLKTFALYCAMFLGAFLIGTGLLVLTGYRLQAAAAMAAIGAGLLVMVVRLFLPNPFHKRKVETAPQHMPTDSAREVIETVVFVVVLVLLLKSFVAEAFVIPTGSMAETLYGYQKVVTCPKCAFVFPVNVSQEVDPSEGRKQTVTGCTCPNCRYHIDLVDTFPNLEWGSGDRVLVGKFFYELVDQPERLDVVVFKYPGGDDFPISGPHKSYIPLNYIKRLIGKSGETIAIYQGKIYILSPELSPKHNDWEEAQHDPEKAARLWQRTYQYQDEPEAIDLFKQGKFTKLRKPPDTMLAMARNVWDNNHPASDLPNAERWKAADGSGWVSDGANGFLNPGDAGAFAWLHYRHILRDANSDHPKSLITDFSGYNTWEVPGMHRGSGPNNWVSDLLLECEVTISKAEGDFALELSRGKDRFQARWHLATGDCDLIRKHDGQEETLGTAKTNVNVKGRTYRLRFADVDEKLTVWVDNTLPFGDNGVPYTSDRTIIPTRENDLEAPASIGVKGGAVKVNKIKLMRDTYYTNDPSQPDYPSVDFSDPRTWGAYEARDGRKVKTIYVQPHHYLCLGDNSPESSDGRSWGSVPERLLLGRAMLVYYPFGRAGKIR